MKCVVEFGVRGGAHTESLTLPTQALASQLARGLVAAFTNDIHSKGATQDDWDMSRFAARRTWQSATHFVAISKLDGVPRGPASAGLWRKPSGPEPLQGEVIPHFEES